MFCSGAAEMKPVYILDLNVSAMMATSWWVPVYGNIAGNIINDELPIYHTGRGFCIQVRVKNNFKSSTNG